MPCCQPPEMIPYVSGAAHSTAGTMKDMRGAHSWQHTSNHRDAAERRTVAGALSGSRECRAGHDALKRPALGRPDRLCATRPHGEGVLLEDTGTRLAEEAATTGALGADSWRPHSL